MTDSREQAFNLDDPELISIIDDVPLWSAPFGIALLDMVRYRSGIRALDIGCGLGFPMIELAQRLGISSVVYGIDPWETALSRVKQKINKLGIRNAIVVNGKAEKLPFADTFFDLIVSNNGLNNVENIAASLAECHRVIKDSGQMVLTMNLPDTMKEFYDVYRAVLRDLGRYADIKKIDEHIFAKRKPLEEMREQLTRAGFAIETIRQEEFALRFADGMAMMNHFLIKLAFLKSWTDILNAADVQTVFEEIELRLNVLSRNKNGLVLTVPVVSLGCRKQYHESVHTAGGANNDSD